MISPFQTTFAVPLSCESCIKEVTTSLYHVEGVHKIDANLANQIVSIEGTAAPSAIVAAIQATGRDAILRGTGAPDKYLTPKLTGDQGAAVCILETHSTQATNKVRGLARIIQVSPSLTLVDLTVRGLSPGKYWATVRETGNISNGATSIGGVWGAVKAPSSRSISSRSARGVLGTVTVGQNGLGTVFLDRPIQIWEMIGRGMVVSKDPDGTSKQDDPDVLVGVIARSAGVWDNDKTVCSCSGKTMWQERTENINRGML